MSDGFMIFLNVWIIIFVCIFLYLGVYGFCRGCGFIKDEYVDDDDQPRDFFAGLLMIFFTGAIIVYCFFNLIKLLG